MEGGGGGYYGSNANGWGRHRGADIMQDFQLLETASSSHDEEVRRGEEC